jgi:hypothetical protein
LQISVVVEEVGFKDQGITEKEGQAQAYEIKPKKAFRGQSR